VQNATSSDLTLVAAVFLAPCRFGSNTLCFFKAALKEAVASSNQEEDVHY